MVNQTCPYRYRCQTLSESYCCDKCGWYDFDFSSVNTTEIEEKIADKRQREGGK